MIPIVDGESNVCSFLLSIGQIPSFMYVVKKHAITNTYNNYNYYYHFQFNQLYLLQHITPTVIINVIIVTTPLLQQFNMFNSSIPSDRDHRKVGTCQVQRLCGFAKTHAMSLRGLFCGQFNCRLRFACVFFGGATKRTCVKFSQT